MEIEETKGANGVAERVNEERYGVRWRNCRGCGNGRHRRKDMYEITIEKRSI